MKETKTEFEQREVDRCINGNDIKKKYSRSSTMKQKHYKKN